MVERPSRSLISLRMLLALAATGLSSVLEPRSLAAQPLEPIREDTAARVARELGATRFDLVSLQLPAEERPELWTVEIELDGVPRLLELEKEEVRAPGFRLLVQEAGGALIERTPGPSRTYRGTLSGEPGSLAAASLLPQGLHARVLGPRGNAWCIRPLREVEPGSLRELHVVFAEADQEFPGCGSGGLEPPPEAFPSAGPGGGGVPADGPCTLKEAEIAFDSDHEFFRDKAGSDAAVCMDIVEAGLNITNAIYIRDLKVTHRLTTLVVRSDPQTDFYRRFPDASDFGAMLDAFRVEWNASMGAVRRDVAYLLTGKPNPELGGLAYVGVVCTNFHYGMGIGGWGYEGIFRHEVGHNWGAGHSCGLERRYIMCGNSLPAISAYNISVMAAHRDSRTCLVEIPHESTPAPPYVRLDRVVTFRGQGPLAIDAVAGDTDLNCAQPRLKSHHAESAFGAAILPLPPLAPGGPDALLYVPRSDLAGTDYFGYTVDDGSGFEAAGAVLVEVRAEGGLVVYLKLDETSGVEAIDSSGAGHDGDLRGALNFASASVPGRHAGALKLSGVAGEYLSLGDDRDFDLQRGLTAAAWFRLDGPVVGNESLIAKGDDAWRIQRDGTGAALRFVCAGLTVVGSPGGVLRGRAAVNDGQWHHAAGVYDGRRVSLYLDGELDASLPASGFINRNTSSVRIGDDRYSGAVDEVRLYNFGLDAEAVRALYSGGRVEAANPPDGATGVVPGADLSWLGAASASAYDVYLGKDQAGVAAASTSSPEYLGRRTVTSVSPARLDLDTTYFWRLDPVQDGVARRGEVRRFSTGFAYTDFEEPPLNAGAFVPGPAHRELGFRTTSRSTGGQSPLSAVVSTGTTPTSPIFSHRSLEATTTLDAVDLTETPGAAVSLTLQIRDTGYEEGEDWLEVHATDGARKLQLLRLEGGNPLTQRAGTSYATFAASIPPGWERASLVLSSSSNSTQGNERYDFDQVSFFCQPRFTVIASTRFEEPAVGANSYTPAAGSRELGFRTQFTASGAQPSAGVVEAGDAVKSRLLVHRSVRATTTFDAVDFGGRQGVRATVVLRVLETGYESTDLLEIWASSGQETADLVRITGTGGLNELAGDFVSFTADLPAAWRQATLVLRSSSDSSNGVEGYEVRLVEFSARPEGGCSEPGPIPFRRGDVNADGRVDLGDPLALLFSLFAGGPVLPCRESGNANADAALDASDAIWVLSYLFQSGAPPAPPGPEACGVPAEEGLGCGSYSCGG